MKTRRSESPPSTPEPRAVAAEEKTRSEGLAGPIVLGIESSCDDTACAVVDGRGRVLSSVVSSQFDVHRPYGGVVPEIASREHLSNWPSVSAAALEQSGCQLADVDLIAATLGPGLVGSLLVGLSLGKALAYALGRPFYAIHHLEGHLYSPFLRQDPVADSLPVPEAFVGLVVSGGHTSMFEVEGGKVSTLAQTRDDAMGEAFDKIGKRIGLPFPGGPRVDELAEAGTAAAHPMTVASCGDSLDFSYSGLKSQTLLALDRLAADGIAPPPDELGESATEDWPQDLLDLLAGFRAAAVGQLVHRLDRLRQRRDLRLLAVSGGVAANRLLRRTLESWCLQHDIGLELVPLHYSGDNAAMIAHAALLRHRHGIPGDPLSAEAKSRMPL